MNPRISQVERLYELSRTEVSFPQTERKAKELKTKIERLAGL
jgi:hypothetical protein